MADEADATGTQQFRRQLDDFLSTAAPGLEEVTTSKAFGSMLAQAVGNMVALHRIGNDVLDLAIRNVRLAGRADVTTLHKQLARTENKLEHVLEVVERLEDELVAERRRNASVAQAQAAGAGDDTDETPPTTTRTTRRGSGGGGTRRATGQDG